MSRCNGCSTKSRCLKKEVNSASAARLAQWLRKSSGRYEFEDNPVYIFGGFMDGPNGVIIIEERRPRI